MVTRRNTVQPTDVVWILSVGALSGVLAALAGCEPTGSVVGDVALCFALGLGVAWAAATAPWWALGIAAAGAAFAAIAGPVIWLVAAWIAFGAAAWLGSVRLSRAPLRAAIASITLQVLLRLEWSSSFGWSAVVAAVLIGLVVLTGLARRPREVRRRARWTIAGVGAAVLVAAAGMGVSGVQARSPAVDGYRGLLLGLDYLQDGKMPEAASALREAADELDTAVSYLTRPWTQPARLVPVLAQNRTIMAEVLARAADAADASADALDVVDLDRLQIVNGQVDLVALADLEAPLTELERTVADLGRALEDADSPWLLEPFQDRLDRARVRADQVSHQARATKEVARLGPAMLGADRPRRYLLAFTNPGESRGTSGLMGNWTEITVIDGVIRESASGRTAELISGLEAASPVSIQGTDEFFARYGHFGAGQQDQPLRPKFLSNVGMSPDMATVGDLLVQLYRPATGRSIDGVFVIDPTGVAALLSVTGPISVPELDVTLSADDVEAFLLVEQYERAESDREAVLEAVTQATIDRVLGGVLPPPQVLARAMSTAALEGNITTWMVASEEQAMIELVGMDGVLPRVPSADDGGPTFDGLAVVNNNASGNKIDSFLERTIVYRPVYDERGWVDATLDITLTNTAPSTGLDDYVIGNLVGLPRGTNRTLLEVFSPLELRSATVEGEPADVWPQEELGWRVYATFLNVAPGGSVTISMELGGPVAGGGYQLVLRPQALPRSDQLLVEARTTSGRSIVSFDGILGRRSVLDDNGVRAWR